LKSYPEELLHVPKFMFDNCETCKSVDSLWWIFLCPNIVLDFVSTI